MIQRAVINQAEAALIGGDLPATATAAFRDALMSCASISELRSLAPLPRDSQELIDTAVVDVGMDRLVLVQDLLSAGLRFSLPDPLSVMELYWEEQTRVGRARRTMIPDSRGERAMPKRRGKRLPIFVTMEDFSFNIRTLRASRRVGAPLDVSMVAIATRNVNEAIEDQAWNGLGFNVDGNTAYGVLNHPNVNTEVYSGGATNAWDNAGKTGDQVLADVLAMIENVQGDGFYGPYNLYVPTAYGLALAKPFSSNYAKTRLEAVLEVPGINAVRVADKLPANRTALIQMTSDVIDVVVGEEPTEVNWFGPGGFRFYGVVMAVMITRVRSNYDASMGVVVGNTA